MNSSNRRPARVNLVVGAWTVLAVGLLSAFAAPAPSALVQEPDGAALYRQHCRSCHGANGVPSPRMMAIYPKLKALDSTFLATRTTDSIVTSLKHGLPGMKPFGDRLSEAELAAVAKFVKTLADSARAP